MTGGPISEPLVTFTTPSIGTPLGGESHPLAIHIQNLGVPVNITLAILGLIIIVIPLGVVTVIREFPKNQDLLPILIMGLSVNVFLRFWPPILIIFIGLLCGWMLADFIPKGGAMK